MPDKGASAMGELPATSIAVPASAARRNASNKQSAPDTVNPRSWRQAAGARSLRLGVLGGSIGSSQLTRAGGARSCASAARRTALAPVAIGSLRSCSSWTAPRSSLGTAAVCPHCRARSGYPGLAGNLTRA